MPPVTPLFAASRAEPLSTPLRRCSRWLRRAARAVKSALREALLYIAGSGASKLRQIEAMQELDPRLLRDTGLDLRDMMRDAPETGKNESVDR